MGFSFEEKKSIFLLDMISRKTKNESTIEPLKNLSDSYYTSRNVSAFIFLFSAVNAMGFFLKTNSYKRNVYGYTSLSSVFVGLLFYKYKLKLLDQLKAQIQHKDNKDLHEKISFYSSCIIEKNKY